MQMKKYSTEVDKEPGILFFAKPKKKKFLAICNQPPGSISTALTGDTFFEV